MSDSFKLLQPVLMFSAFMLSLLPESKLQAFPDGPEISSPLVSDFPSNWVRGNPEWGVRPLFAPGITERVYSVQNLEPMSTHNVLPKDGESETRVAALFLRICDRMTKRTFLQKS